MATPTAHIGAQSQNDIDRNVRQYKDLDLFFGTKQASNDINKVTDIQAVKRSVRNLVLLNHYEKPFHPEIGSGVRDILFENMTPTTAHILTRKIEMVIEQLTARGVMKTSALYEQPFTSLHVGGPDEMFSNKPGVREGIFQTLGRIESDLRTAVA